MALTPAQFISLKADIAADPVLSLLAENDDNAFAIAAAYNLEAVPPYTVWRNQIPTSEVKQNVVWTEYINDTTVGERDAFVFMLSNGTIDAGDANIRQGFQDIFSGAAKATTRGNMVTMAKRLATRAEALLATGTGSDASPGTTAFEGALSFADISRAWNA